MTLEKRDGIVIFDKMWIFETNFSRFPFFRKSSCSMRVRNRMILYFTLLPSTPQMLFGMNSSCSLTNLVCDSAVHFFFKNHGYCHFYTVCCLLCCHVLCLVFFSLNTYYLRNSFVNFMVCSPAEYYYLWLSAVCGITFTLYPKFPSVSYIFYWKPLLTFLNWNVWL